MWGLDAVEREIIEDNVDKWIQEIERVVEESMDHMEEFELNEDGEAWDDVHGAVSYTHLRAHETLSDL
eukprot:10275400-Karenia_brevis.AAC.1